MNANKYHILILSLFLSCSLYKTSDISGNFDKSYVYENDIKIIIYYNLNKVYDRYLTPEQLKKYYEIKIEVGKNIIAPIAGLGII